MSGTTSHDVALWMAAQIEANGYLAQGDAAWLIDRDFGDEFVYENANGNLGISRAVLREFRTLTEQTVVWERGERAWRSRMAGDPQGRQAE